jgi:hypothetical protein
MMRKFTTCLMLYSCFLLGSCSPDEEAEVPPAASFTVNTAAGKANDTEFTFTVNQVDADVITLFPYGRDKFKLGTVDISKSAFKDGKATVKYTYSQVGQFSAVIITNNHSDDGSSVQNTTSAVTAITVTSDRASLASIGLEFVKDATTTIKSYSTTPDPLAVGPVTVYLPFGADITKLRATFTASPFSVVKIGGVTQVSGETVNDFTTPKTVTVTSQDGVVTSPYVVTAVVKTAETYQGLKAIAGALTSKSAKNKVIPAYADSVSNFVVFYDTIGTPVNKFDSIRIAYTLTGKFAKNSVAQDALIEGITSTQGSKNFVVTAQDPAVPTKKYDLYAVAAPKFTIEFTGTNVLIKGKTNNFTIDIRTLKEAGVSHATTFNFNTPAGVTVDNVKVKGNVVNSGDVIDYTKPVNFNITVTDSNIGKTYVVTYTATLVQL